MFRVKSEQKAVALANDSFHGLGDSVVMTNVTRSKRIAVQLGTGMVLISDAVISPRRLPFDGVKTSGVGREAVRTWHP